MPVTEDDIEHMTQRFLGWKLPKNFNPDNGISFDPIGSKGTPAEYVREPSGTNLFDYVQAKEMIRHMVDGLAQSNLE